ncbi:MATE family efflux transporter [Flavonifractor sp. An135]|nr:MATE family efflux transporter [Flavonifractor sp. An135]OUQ26395.1 MATE family efflux transporter [Flavonifractor sp. An135]
MRSMAENPLGSEKIATLLRSYAIPSITATLVSSLYNIVDQVFIGQGVGYLGNAATNVSYPLSTICLAIALLLGIGSASRFSIFLGKGNPDKAARLVGNGVVWMAMAGLLYLLLGELFLSPLLRLFGATAEAMPLAREYAGIVLIGMPFLILTNGISNLIRADGSPRYSMLCMVAGAVVNTVLDPIFIFCLHWGVAGAALATILGQILSFGLALRYLWRFRTVQLSRDCFRLDLRDNLRTFYMGISNSVNQLAITLVQIVLNNSLTFYGAQSIYGEDIPLAACGIVMKTNAILLSIIVGISQGVQPIIGFNYGAGKYDRVQQAYRLAVCWNLVVSAVGFCLFQFFPGPILALFGSGEPLYFEFATRFMRIFLFMVLVNGVQLLSSNFFTAIGKALKGLLLSLTRQVFFLIPLILILPLRLGIWGVLLAAPIADGIAFLLSVFLVKREFRSLRARQAALH